MYLLEDEDDKFRWQKATQEFCSLLYKTLLGTINSGRCTAEALIGKDSLNGQIEGQWSFWGELKPNLNPSRSVLQVAKSRRAQKFAQLRLGLRGSAKPDFLLAAPYRTSSEVSFMLVSGLPGEVWYGFKS